MVSISNSNYPANKTNKQTTVSYYVQYNSFDSRMESLVKHRRQPSMSKEDKDKEICTVQINQLGNIFQCDYLLLSNEFDDTNDYGTQCGLTIINEVASNTEQETKSTTAYDIKQLTSIFETVLTQFQKDDKSLWKVSYIDQSIAKLDLLIKKTNENSLTITLASANSDKNKIHEIISDLHSKLLKKGWMSRIEQQNSKIFYEQTEK